MEGITENEQDKVRKQTKHAFATDKAEIAPRDVAAAARLGFSNKRA